ncbi:MAG: amidophosphoribosyltransferase [bacterium]
MHEIKEACGIFGAFGAPEAAYEVYCGLYALQHRGQESAGIVSSDGENIRSHKGMGLVGNVFSREVFKSLVGEIAIGHVRYSTTGSSRIQNIQPLVVRYAKGLLAISHNGNIVNARRLKRSHEKSGSIYQTGTDSEVLAHLLARPSHQKLQDPLAHCLAHLQGSFSFLLLERDRIVGIRDPHGFRPLVLGRRGKAFFLASETCAFDLIRADYVRSLEPGEILTITKGGLRSDRIEGVRPQRMAHCIFELIYFARPDSIVFDQSVHSVRVEFGRMLAREAPVEADFVIPVPDSGISPAIGYAHASGIPFERGFIRNHYVGRTFIEPEQSGRVEGVRFKLNVVKDVVRNRRLVVVDDSIIRGTTSRSRVQALRDAGAREIHLRIASPPCKHPCYFGIDFPSSRELIASKKSTEQIRKYLGVESLAYLQIDSMLACVLQPRHDYCHACFSGSYPVAVKSRRSKLDLESDGSSAATADEAGPTGLVAR